MKRIAVLPTLLTLGNGVCGFAAIAYASKITHDGSLTSAQINNYFLLSATLILLAMIFDALDGLAARLTRSASEFGGQLDSLCDAISFGAAPAFLLLRLGQEWDHRPVIAKTVAVIAAVYLACTILRLARFNTENTPDPSSHKRFKGLPSPAAGGALASLAVLRSGFTASWTGLDEVLLHEFVKVWAPIGAFVLALLMVSRLPYPHFTRQVVRGRHNFTAVVQVVLVLGVVALAPDLAFFLLFWIYALNGPVRYALSRFLREPARRTARGWIDFPGFDMFTGLVEGMGSVQSLASDGPGRRLTLAVPFAAELVLGESVCINGTCLTVVHRDDATCAFEVGPETLLRTNLGELAPGDRVNLERSLRMGDRLGGHWVQGHVDGVGHVDQRLPDGEWLTVWFRCPPDLAAQMVPKGSVAVDGISLTVVGVEPARFSVALIPHTLSLTTLGFKGPGSAVNLETDILAKYVQKCLLAQRPT